MERRVELPIKIVAFHPNRTGMRAVAELILKALPARAFST